MTIVYIDEYRSEKTGEKTMITNDEIKYDYYIVELQERNYISNVEEIANYFLTKESMSNKKLQKICYYAYSWTLTLLNNPEDKKIENFLFDDKFEGWVHGTVCKRLYDNYKEYGWNDIPMNHDINVQLPEEIRDILDQVWDVYGLHTGNELEDITHQEDPWKESRIGLSTFEPGRREISDNTIFNYYSRKVRN